jgi:paraquat-inducible protein B
MPIVIRKPQPKLIGAFVSVSLLLLVGLVLFFGSSSLFRRTTHFILFFDQSVNGLNVGSPVKFRGVPVGSVERIMIRAVGQDPDSTAIPVVIKINRSRLENDLGVSATAFEPETIQASLDLGLVAQLNLESFITGQLFVEFSFEPEKTETFHLHQGEASDMMEIPTLASSLDQITGDIAQLISGVGAIDLPRLNENLNTALENLAVFLAGIDSGGITESVTQAADQVTALASSEDFKKTIIAIRTAFEELKSTSVSLNMDKGPLAKRLDLWTTKFTHTLDGVDQLAGSVDSLLQPDSSMRYQFENTLRELSQTAKSIRMLTEYLERNPNALLTGRPDPAKE